MAELDSAQLEQLSDWQAGLSAFDYRFEDNPGRADNLVTTVIFAGQGEEKVGDAQREEIVIWARQIHASLLEREAAEVGATRSVQTRVILEQPVSGDTLLSPVRVKGRAVNTGEALVIRVQDEEGEVVGQTLADVEAELGHEGPFAAQVMFTQPPRDQTGRIVVLSTQASEVTTEALASVEVQLEGQDDQGETVVVMPHLRRYQGPGFSFPYLADAVVERVGDEQWQLTGRSVRVRPAEADWMWLGRAYQLQVTRYPNDEGLTSTEWAEAYLLDAWEDAQASKEPFSGPVTAEGEIEEDAITPVRMGDKAAAQVDWFAGDSTRRVVYLSLRDETLAFACQISPVENNPLALPAADICGLTLMQVEAPRAQGVSRTMPPVMGVTENTGPGFRLLVPPNASLAEVEADHWELRGPGIQVRPLDADWVWDGPAYQLDLVLHDNSEKLDAVAWAEAHLLEAWAEAQESEVPFTGPIDKEGNLVQDAIAEIMIGDQEALQADWTAGDSIHRVIYVKAADKILAVHYNVFPVENHPVAPVANAVHGLLVAGLRTGS
jgi:hypothetical protein